MDSLRSISVGGAFGTPQMSNNYFNKPENALRRAKELESVGQDASALSTLKSILTARKYKHAWTQTLEDIMRQYLVLAIKLKHDVKDVMLQYRNVCQNPPGQMHSLEAVMREYLDLSMKKCQAAKYEADKVTGRTQEDFDLQETPESMLMQVVAGENMADRKDRQILTPWIRYLWEAFRTVLDVGRNNSKLLTFYHWACREGFKFCKKYNRTNEFRRFCETLRIHADGIPRNQHLTNAVDIKDPAVQALYLHTRFQQLKIASDLKQWQEAYRTIDDIHSNLTASAGLVSAELMKVYYLKLAEIFRASNNTLFHAYALHRVVDQARRVEQNEEKEKTNEDDEEKDEDEEASIPLTELADSAVLATLSIPLTNSSLTSDESVASFTDFFESESDSNLRLAQLLGFQREIPTRNRLVQNLSDHGVVKLCSQEVQNLVKLFNNWDYSPLSMGPNMKPVLDWMNQLEENDRRSQYKTDLQTIVVLLVIQALRKVYSTLNVERFLSLMPQGVTMLDVEALILQESSRDTLTLRIDHRSNTIHFYEDDMTTPALRGQLSVLAKSIQEITDLVSPVDAQHKMQERQNVYEAVHAGIEEEHSSITVRMEEIDQRHKAKTESDQKKKAAKIAEAEEAIRAKAEEEKRRQEKEEKRREVLRQAAERDHKELVQKNMYAEQVRKTLAKGSANARATAATRKELDDLLENLASKDVKKEQLIVAELKVTKERQAAVERHRQDQTKMLQYTVRALREEEEPLINAKAAERDVENKKTFELEEKQRLVEDRKNHERRLQDRERLKQREKYKNAFVALLTAKYTAEWEQEKKEREIYEAQRIARAKKAEAERLRKEEEDRIAAERQRLLDEERAAAAEEARLKREAEQAERDREAEEKRQKLRAMAEKQAAREAELDARSQGQRDKFGGRSGFRENRDSGESRSDKDTWTRVGDSGRPAFRARGPKRDEAPQDEDNDKWSTVRGKNSGRSGFRKDKTPPRGGRSGFGRRDDDEGPPRRSGFGPRKDEDDGKGRSGFGRRDDRGRGFGRRDDDDSRGGDRRSGFGDKRQGGFGRRDGDREGGDRPERRSGFGNKSSGQSDSDKWRRK